MILKKSKLGDVCKIQSGNSIPPKEKDDLYRNINEGLPYVATKDIGLDGSINFENGVRIPSEFDKKFRLSEKNSVLVCAEGGSAGKKIAYSNKDCYFVNKLFSIKPTNEIDSKYIYYYTLSNVFQKKFKESLHGLIGGVSLSKIKNFQIVYPSLSEQQHIVAKLDAAFAEIDRTILNVEKKLTNTIKLANTILSKFFEKNDIGWKDIILNDVCKNITDGKHGDCKPQENSGFYFLSAKDVKNNILNYEKARQITKDDFLETHRRTNLEPGDLVITNSGTIGRMAIVDGNSKTYQTTFQKSVAVLKPIHDVVDNKFLFYLLNSRLKYFTNISQGAAQKNLLLRDIRGIKIKLPVSLDEQVTISRKCQSLLNYIKEIELTYKTKHKNLIQLKQSILTQELNGEFKQAS